MFEAKRTAAVTIPSLSFKKKTRLYIHILSKMHTSEKVGEEDDGREPATICRVINLEDNTLYELICPTLLVSSLDRYPMDYVGRSFEVNVSAAAREGKRYRDVTVFEIENPADIKAIVAAAMLPEPGETIDKGTGEVKRPAGMTATNQ